MKQFITSVLLFTCLISFAQYPVPINLENARILYNPAFTNAQKSLSLDVVYQNRWPSISANYITSMFQVSQSLGNHGIGFSYMRDVSAKAIFDHSYKLSYAYKVKTKLFNIAAGVNVSYDNTRIDWNKLTFGDAIDPRRGFVYGTNNPTTLNEPRYGLASGAGLLIYSERFYTSVSASNALPMVEENYGYQILWLGEAGYRISFNDDLSITPRYMISHQNKFNRHIVGAKIDFRGVNLTGMYDLNDEILLGVGYSNEVFNINVNYGVMESALSNSGVATYLVSAGLNLDTFKAKLNNEIFNF